MSSLEWVCVQGAGRSPSVRDFDCCLCNGAGTWGLAGFLQSTPFLESLFLQQQGTNSPWLVAAVIWEPQEKGKE